MPPSLLIKLPALCAVLCSLIPLHARETIPFNDDWEFAHANELSERFPDERSRKVSVPHDWSWEVGPQKDGAQLDKGGYRIGGVGWYRKHFTIPQSFEGKRVFARFDGAYRNARVSLNGKVLGTRPYGFISFQYDLSEHLVPGKNLIEVRLDCTREPSTRWYHPCGLYAPVSLTATDFQSRLVTDGIFITTPTVTAKSATVRITSEVVQPEGLNLEATVLAPDGTEIARNSRSATSPEFTFTIANPGLWSPDTPELYKAIVTLQRGGTTVDQLEIPFGIRSIQWDKNRGFLLNGQQTKLRGVCEHLTGGPLGGAWTDSHLEWKLRLLKSMGCNAIRTAHNPHTPSFYKLCDQLGILVMDEIFDGWEKKAPEDYGALDFQKWWRRDLTAWIRRDRNHPSVIIWSVGNETRGSVSKDLVELCHKLDPTRLVTSGASGSDAMDVIGINGHSESQKFFKEGPFDRPFVATEATHTWQVRGHYKSMTWYRDGFPNKRQDPFEIPDLTPHEIFTQALFARGDMANRKQVFNSSYDNATVRINARQHWEKTRDLPWISGHFRWTGFDYPGEAGYVHGGWPFHAFAGGAIDLAGFEKDLYHFYRSQWTGEPMVHILPHWTHPKMPSGTRIPIHVYSNADEVELFLNGTSLGVDQPGRKWDEMQCEWFVPWQPGTLTAIARREGKEIARDERRTASSPMQLRIETDTTFENYPILTLNAVDRDGHPYPYGENRIHARVDGPARILSFENGHPADTDPPVAAQRRAFMGKARLFLEGQPTSITFGSILGERRQLTSHLVAIDAQRMDSAGGVSTAGLAIHYTLDGSTPTGESPRYSAPFAVPPVCTVKAIVTLENEPILALEESFGPTLGLHWATDGETQEQGPATAIQAESAKFSNAMVTKKGTGFHGTGYLDFKGKEGKMEFYRENDGPAGEATLIIRYAHADPKRRRPLAVMLNGKKLTTAKFPPTGSWDSNWKTLEVPAHLVPGANTLILRTTGESSPNIDQIEFR